MRTFWNFFFGLIAVLIIVALTIFAVQNVVPVTVQFITASFEGNVWWISAGSAVLGLFLGLVLLAPGRIAAAWRTRMLGERSESMDQELEAVRAERDRVVAERDRIARERDRAAAERDRVVSERDQLRAERDRMVSEREQTLLRLEAERRAAQRAGAYTAPTDTRAPQPQPSEGAPQPQAERAPQPPPEQEHGPEGRPYSPL